MGGGLWSPLFLSITNLGQFDHYIFSPDREFSKRQKAPTFDSLVADRGKTLARFPRSVVECLRSSQTARPVWRI
jgi:hypothetical protein